MKTSIHPWETTVARTPLISVPTALASTQGTSRSGRGAAPPASSHSDSPVDPVTPQQHHTQNHQNDRIPAAVRRNAEEASTFPSTFPSTVPEEASTFPSTFPSTVPEEASTFPSTFPSTLPEEASTFPSTFREEAAVPEEASTFPSTFPSTVPFNPSFNPSGRKLRPFLRPFGRTVPEEASTFPSSCRS